MSCVCIIPARGGSQRIPGKNIRDFHGQPILAYSIQTAKRSGLFNSIVVTTDDDNIGRVASEYGARWIRRSEGYGEDSVGTQDVIRDALCLIEDGQMDSMAYKDPIRYVCCIYPCAPLLTPEMLRVAFSWLATGERSYVVPVGQWLSDPGMFYFGLARAFMDDVPLLGMRTGLLPVDGNRCIDINTEDDWKKAEEMYAAINS